ncbi:MAG: M28 family metallopeptidase [Mycobacterium sp.]
MRRTSRAIAATLLVVATVGCARTSGLAQSAVTGGSAAEFATGLQKQVSVDAMFAHLTKLQDIANDNDGTRAVGTSGYEDSVDYVAEVLRGKGFEVTTPEFSTRVFKADKPVLTVGGVEIVAKALEFSAGTPGLDGPLVAAPADETPGCVPADYDGLPVRGAVILVDRGSCHFSEKEAIAAKLGAIALIVADNVDEEKMGGTLGEDSRVQIPVVGISKADGARLRADPGPVTLKLDAGTRDVKARNVIAQTKTGSAQNVVLVGAHLDSVPAGPGINDNASGVAAVLATAEALGSAPEVRNAVRFGFWGAEEIGLVGSKRYVASLNVEQLRDIALYLNFDMIASPNPGYFTYDGDQSAPIVGGGVPRVPEGSPGIERAFVGYLKSQGKIAEDTSFDGRSDYDGFTMAGIPAGGLFSGADENKTAEQAKLWGGTADAPFDPNYHKATDTLDRIDRDALRINGGGVPYVVGLYAQDLGGRNGMPVPDDRTRHVLPQS